MRLPASPLGLARIADAAQPPIRSGAVAALASVLSPTDVEDYGAVCRAAASALVCGGRFAHSCSCGALVDRSDQARLVVSPGYWRGERRFDGCHPTGYVPAWAPSTFLLRIGRGDHPAGLIIDAVIEAGDPTRDALAVRAICILDSRLWSAPDRGGVGAVRHYGRRPVSPTTIRARRGLLARAGAVTTV